MTVGNIIPGKSIVLGGRAEVLPSHPGDAPPAINSGQSSVGPGATLRLERLGGRQLCSLQMGGTNTTPESASELTGRGSATVIHASRGDTTQGSQT